MQFVKCVNVKQKRRALKIYSALVYYSFVAHTKDVSLITTSPKNAISCFHFSYSKWDQKTL